MRLQEISIRGFKCFRALDLPVAGLTVLSGFNASGKSTTLQSLLLMAQGLRTSPSAEHLPLNGPLVRLGTAGDVVARGFKDPVEFAFSSVEHRAHWSFRSYGSADLDADLEDQRGDRERLTLMVQASGMNGLGSAVQTHRIRPHSRDDDPWLDALRDIIFLGGTRNSQLDVYPSPDDAEPIHADVGFEGQYAAWWYARSADNEVPAARRHPEDPRITMRAQVDAWLGHLFPGAEASAETVRGTALTKLVFRMGRSSDWSRPANIGYGLSYAFPLIVALLAAREGQILVVDSPEAHLHPRAQSRMGQMLARFASVGIQILVETHSDHVLSGIRLAVRDRLLDPKEVAIHFFSGAKGETDNGVVSPLIDVKGGLSAWPEGFFDQADNDLIELTQPA